MFKNKRTVSEPSLDKHLADAEQGVTGNLLYSIGGQIKSRPEFADRLEDALRDKTAQPALQGALYLGAGIQPERRVTNFAGLGPGQRRIGLGLVGMTLGLAMVIMLGFLVLFGGKHGTASVRQVTSALARSPLASSVLMQAWNDDQQRYETRPINPATGEALPGYAPITGGGTLSPDSSKLAMIESTSQACRPSAGGSSCSGSADILHLTDLQAWHDMTFTLSVTLFTKPKDADEARIAGLNRGWVEKTAFSPDSKRLALAYNQYRLDDHKILHAIVLVDASNGKTVTEKEIAFLPSLLEFSQDGSRLIAYGQAEGTNPDISEPSPLQVLLLDGTTLDTKWSHTLGNIVSGRWCAEGCNQGHDQMLLEWWTPAAVLSNDKRMLYIVHADVDRLTTVDLDAHTVQSVDVRAEQSWFEDLLGLTATTAEAKGGVTGISKSAVLSADGTRLYVTGVRMEPDFKVYQKALGLAVISVENGHKIGSVELVSDATSAAIVPDGTNLYLRSQRSTGNDRRQETEVLDAKSLQHIATIDGWDIIQARRLGGEAVLLGNHFNAEDQSTELGQLDTQTLKVAHPWKVMHWGGFISAP